MDFVIMSKAFIFLYTLTIYKVSTSYQYCFFCNCSFATI